MKIFAKIRFIYRAIIIFFIAGGIMVPLLLINHKRYSYILHRYNALIMKLMGVKIITRGKRDNSVDMFVINHQGIMDIISMEAQENSNIRWVAKRELFELPWFGKLLSLSDMVNVDREDKSGLIKLLKDAKETKESKKHRILTIFPEGTRNKNQKLRKFKSGAKIVAEKFNMKIQPIVITNSKAIFNEHNFTASPIKEIHITYLDSFIVDKKDKDWYKKLQDRMQKVIAQEEEKGRFR